MKFRSTLQVISLHIDQFKHIKFPYVYLLLSFFSFRLIHNTLTPKSIQHTNHFFYQNKNW